MAPSIIFKSHHELEEYQGSNNTLDYIDHELSVNLDSTNAFEGPEKLLEIWFAPSENSLPSNWPRNGLRDIPLSDIEAMLDLVSCKILSKKFSPILDAYLLSESSLFVYPHKMILKTCGTTTTLFCLSKLLELVIKYCNYQFDSLSEVYRVFYSHRSFMFPHKQNQIHQNWSSEIAFLNKYFPVLNSKTYVLGDMSDDHWHLYINGTNSLLPIISPPSPPYPISADPKIPSDLTLELLMTDLDSKTASQFQLSHYNLPESMDPDTDDAGHIVGKSMMSRSGLSSIFKPKVGNIHSKHDSFAFTPCGFSSNSILEDKYYYTLHITPEKGWSYASFETNCPLGNLTDAMNKVVEILKPGKFTMVICDESDEDTIEKVCDVTGYKRGEKIISDLKFGYKLVYCFFEKL